jgi:hypothetical protein
MSLTRNLLGIATGHTIPTIPSQGRQSCQLRREGWTRTIKELLLTCDSNWRRNYPAEPPLSRGLAAYQFSPAEGLVRQFFKTRA